MTDLNRFNFSQIILDKSYDHFDLSTRLSLQYGRALHNTEVGKLVLKKIKGDPRVKKLEGNHLNRGLGSEIFAIENLAKWFLWRAIQVGLEEANKNLDLFLNNENIEVIIANWILGISVENSIRFDNGIEIIPAELMPDSDHKEAFLQHGNHRYPASVMPMPRSALVQRIKIRRLIKSTPSPGIDTVKVIRKSVVEMRDVALLFNLLSGLSCVWFFESSYFPDDTPIGPFGGSGGSGMTDHFASFHQNRYRDNLTSELLVLLEAYTRLTDKKKSPFVIAISRLSMAKRRQKIEEKLLDLCISLEMLLLKDADEKSQISLQFSLRGSWLISTDHSQRRALYSTLKKLYNYRSRIAHSGTLKPSEQQEATELWPQFECIGEKIIKTLLIRTPPDWNDLILGVEHEKAEK